MLKLARPDAADEIAEELLAPHRSKAAIAGIGGRA
jgi:hypothetical protein